MNEQKCRLFDRLCQDSILLQAWNAVRRKGSTGGIDYMSVGAFEQCSDVYLKEIKQNLESRRWTPKPYLRISIPKKGNERRSLGLLTVTDKVVQQAIKLVIEPIFEKMFVSNSYGYRQGKGHIDAVRFADVCFRNRKMKYVLRLDIDNYFDTIDHKILFDNLAEVIDDEEVLRLIQLCVKMGGCKQAIRME